MEQAEGKLNELGLGDVSNFFVNGMDAIEKIKKILDLKLKDKKQPQPLLPISYVFLDMAMP